MADKKLTPIQEAIKFWTERYKEAKEAGATKTMDAADLFLQYLNVMLYKEKEFAKDMFDAGNELGGLATFDEKFKQYEP